MAIRTPQHEAYHRQPPILFQLILSDFLSSFEKVFVLREIHERLQNLAINGCSVPKLQQSLMALQNNAKSLSGEPEVNAPFYSWNFFDGILRKLKSHCSLLATCSSEPPQEFILLNHQANRAWLTCLQALDLGKVLQHLPHEEVWDSEEYASLGRTFERITTLMGRISRQITKLFSHFKDDENVLYFLIRHHQEFDTIFGPQYVTKLFSKLFNEGASDVEKLLVRRYKKRGFTLHVDAIKTHLSSF